MRRRGELQANDPGFWEGRVDCLDDFKLGKRLLPKGLQMHRQAPLFSSTGSSIKERNLCYFKEGNSF